MNVSFIVMQRIPAQKEVKLQPCAKESKIQVDHLVSSKLILCNLYQIEIFQRHQRFERIFMESRLEITLLFSNIIQMLKLIPMEYRYFLLLHTNSLIYQDKMPF